MRVQHSSIRDRRKLSSVVRAATEFRDLQRDRGLSRAARHSLDVSLRLYVDKVKIQISLKAYGGLGYGSTLSYSLYYILHASAALPAVWAPEPL